MNLSDWPATQAAQGLLVAACAGIQTGRMPLAQYLWMHPSARLTAEEKKLFCDWTAAEIARLRSATRASTSPATASGTPPAP